MKFSISDEIKQSTTDCKKGFLCLEGNREKFGKVKVKECVDGKIYFLECLVETKCSYKISFGTSYYCSCPTRKELFKKYNV